MGKTRKPRDFLMKRKDVLKQKKSRPQTQRILSPLGMMEIMKKRNPEEFAEALRNLKKTCKVCDSIYYGHGHSHGEGVICADCFDCFSGEDINEKSIEIVRAYRRTRDGGRTKTETFCENVSQVCPPFSFSGGETKTDKEHSPTNETTENDRKTAEEE